MPSLGFGIPDPSQNVLGYPAQPGPTRPLGEDDEESPSTGRILGRLSNGRPIVENEDGSFSTHRNMVVNLDGKSYIVPTFYGGQMYSPEEAISIIKRNNMVDPDTGQRLQAYDSDEEALSAEQVLHDKLEAEAMRILHLNKE